jgi:hypothetical protein
MAKKAKKRSVSSSVVKSAPQEAPAQKQAARAGTLDFNPDYSYVKKDLKRIGILAGSFFTILVVLSFFLR